jgi:glycosyltransferase involved in cell wall biosynthesis
MTSFRTDYQGSVPRILLHPYNQHMNGSIRQDGPAKVMREKGLAITRVDPKEVAPDVLQMLNPDVIVLPSVFTDTHLNMMNRYVKNSPSSFLVYDLEDVLWEVPTHNPSYVATPKDMKKRLSKAINIAHRVTVTTETLADLVAKDFRIPRTKIRVIPNAISRSFLNACKSVTRTPNTSDRLRVGWAGGASHQKDLNILTEVVKATADKYQWVFMGFMPEGVEGLVEFHEPVELADYPRALAELNLDIAVAPLEDTKFTSGKSDLRVLEYAACGYPVIASEVPAFTAGGGIGNGLLCVDGNSAQEWMEGIEWLEHTEGFRRGIADRLHDWLLKNRMQDSPAIIEAIMDGWLPVGAKNIRQRHEKDLPASFKRVPNGYLVTRPDTEVTEIPLQGIYNSGIASVSAVSNDGFYPTLGKFTGLNEEASKVLPSAAFTLDPTPVEIPRIAGPYTYLSDHAINAVGMPDFARFGSVSAALMEWSIRTVEAGFRHMLKPNVFAQSTALLSHAAREIVAWYPPAVMKGVEEKSAILQEGVVDALSKLDCAAFRLIPTTKHRILHINGVQESPIKEKLLEDGNTVLSASILGHLLTLDPRFVIYVEPLDLRRDIDRFIEIIDTCGFDMVLLDGLREGSPEVLGTFAEMANRGVNVRYINNEMEAFCPRIDMNQPDGPCNIRERASQEGFDADSYCTLCVRRHGSPYGYVNASAYRATWQDFLSVIYRPTVPSVEAAE